MELASKIILLIICFITIELVLSTSSMKRTSLIFKQYPRYHRFSNFKLNKTHQPCIIAFQTRLPHTITRTLQNNNVLFSASPLHVTRRKKSTLTFEDVMKLEDGQLDPMSVDNGTISMPKALSPSAAAEFKNCPQSFFFQYILSIKQPPNSALAKGSMCHSALEQIFDLEPRERTLQHLQNLFRKNWSEVRLSDAYGPLFEKQNGEFEHERDIDSERKWGNEALELLNNYYQLEDPRMIPKPNPLEREIWVTAHLALDSRKGATGVGKDMNTTTEEEETFFMRGIVDRLDFVAVPPSPHDHNDDNEGAIRIVDYKTGKAPNFKYSPAMNQKIAEDNLWQLKIYALLLIEMIKNDKAYSKSGNLQKISVEDIRLLRLMYLTSVDGNARFLDMDLGKTQDERNKVLQDVHEELSDIWKSISHLVGQQNPKAFVHCDREWCCCHKIRPKFIRESLNQ